MGRYLSEWGILDLGNLYSLLSPQLKIISSIALLHVACIYTIYTALVWNFPALKTLRQHKKRGFMHSINWKINKMREKSITQNLAVLEVYHERDHVRLWRTAETLSRETSSAALASCNAYLHTHSGPQAKGFAQG